MVAVSENRSSAGGFASSAIRDVAYMAPARELRVTFASGRSYAYMNVPQTIYEAFMASPSKGTFFNIAIRGRYHFHEVSSADEPFH